MNSTSDVLTGVSAAVYKATGIPVYLEFKENTMQFPCFFISLVESSEDLHVSSLYSRNLDFEVLYFLNEDDLPDDVRGELHDMGERLYGVLEYITVNGRLIRTTKRKYKVTDGVMLFLLSVEDIRRKQGARMDPMHTATLHEEVKNGN